MIPLWYRFRNGKFVTLTHYPDGHIGISVEDMTHYSPKDFYFEDFSYDLRQDRYLLRPHALTGYQNRLIDEEKP